MTNRFKTFFLTLALVGFPAFGQLNERTCGSLANGFGPFDYRAERDPNTPGTGDHKHKLYLVEGAHFNRNVELLIRGKSATLPGGDIDYTLRAFPNHHRALMSVMKYGQKTGSQKPEGLQYEVECYFERAIRFSKDDVIVFMLYATYLNSRKRQAEAVPLLERAAAIAKTDPFSQFNIGLIYYDMKMYDRALAQAHRAKSLGFERDDLQQLLAKVDQWKDAPPAPAKQ
jgi:tetratricopeptide (TPR) repeat protein